MKIIYTSSPEVQTNARQNPSLKYVRERPVFIEIPSMNVDATSADKAFNGAANQLKSCYLTSINSALSELADYLR